MSRLTISWRVSLAAGTAVVSAAVLSAVLLFQLRSTSTSYDLLLGQDEVQHQDRARVMQVEFKKQVQEWKNLLLRGYKHEDFRKHEQAFHDEESQVRRAATELLAAVQDAEARRQIEEFVAAHERMAASYAAAITAFEKSNGTEPVAADALVKGLDRQPTDAIDALVERLKQVVAERRAVESARVGSALLRSTVVVIVVLVSVVGAVFYIVRVTRREMVALVTHLTDAVSSTELASHQVSRSSQSLSQGATEQAASLEETSASMEEMASMARRNSQNTEEVAKVVTDVDRRVAESNQALTTMVASMTAIQESSTKVSNIIKTIDEIAFQTNILALNAAVEAARAGEAGMGFAVVADEVRNLAQRSAQAAKDTAALIEESMQRAQEGSGRVELVATSISAITESVSRVKVLVDEVREASAQQTQGIDQVAQAVAQMEKVTQTTAATAEESAAASEELKAQAESVAGVVANLDTLVGTGHARASAKAAPVPVAAWPKNPTAARGAIASTAQSSNPDDAFWLAPTGTEGVPLRRHRR